MDVYLTDRKIGDLTELPRGNYRFEYDDAWQRNPRHIPLSRSMPLPQQRHPDRAVRYFMWGLLPDNEKTLDNWGKRFQVSPKNPFALLAAIGEDCPGAVQLVPSDVELKGRESIRWLTRKEIDARIVALKADPGAGRLEGDQGQFSLAGAQAKTALYRVNNRWGIPQGRTPTTHILKPDTGRIQDVASNEHFCLNLARRMSLPAAISEVEVFAGVPTIVVQRFDRIRKTNGVLRIHQEDMCQALGVNPFRKYQQEGGPTIKHIMAVLEESNAPEIDRDRFMRAQALNFVILGTDAHARNYSIIYAPGGAFRLTPLYDVISFIPYTKDRAAANLAMAISGHRRAGEIMPRHWEELAAAVRYLPDRAVAHVRDMIAQLPAEAAALHAEVRESGLRNKVLDALTKGIADRCKALKEVYGAEVLVL